MTKFEFPEIKMVCRKGIESMPNMIILQENRIDVMCDFIHCYKKNACQPTIDGILSYVLDNKPNLGEN